MLFPRLLHLRQYAQTLACIGLLALAGAPTVAAQAGNEAQAVLGKWRLTAALDASEITSLNEHEAQQLVGRVFTVSKTHVTFGSRDCGAPALSVERVEPRLYLREQAHASAARLRLPNPVSVVDLGCTVAFIKRQDRLVIHWQGWFFDASRVR